MKARATISPRSGLRLYRLIPRPCGHSHAHLREIYLCVREHGVPGFDVVPETPAVPEA